LIFQKYYRMIWLWLTWLGSAQVVGFFEHCDESSGTMKCRDYLDCLRKWEVLKMTVLHGI
jgi:hypothetical protein